MENRLMDVVLLTKHNWKPSELTYIFTRLGPIVSPNTYNAILVDRTPGGWRWYAWERRKGGWLVVAGSLEEMVEGVLEEVNGKEKENNSHGCHGN